MRHVIYLDALHRVTGSDYIEYARPEGIPVETLPTGETVKEKDLTNYLYENGQFVYDPLPDPEPIPVIDLEKIDAQVLYTAMLTDTLIEEDEE